MNTLSLPASIALLVALSTTSWALECPTLATLGASSSAATIEQLLPADTDLDAPDAMQSAVVDLKRAGVPQDLILDSLIGIYCHAVEALPGLSDDDKTQRIQAFSQSASAIVFADID